MACSAHAWAYHHVKLGIALFNDKRAAQANRLRVMDWWHRQGGQDDGLRRSGARRCRFVLPSHVSFRTSSPYLAASVLRMAVTKLASPLRAEASTRRTWVRSLAVGRARAVSAAGLAPAPRQRSGRGSHLALLALGRQKVAQQRELVGVVVLEDHAAVLRGCGLNEAVLRGQGGESVWGLSAAGLPLGRPLQSGSGCHRWPGWCWASSVLTGKEGRCSVSSARNGQQSRRQRRRGRRHPRQQWVLTSQLTPARRLEPAPAPMKNAPGSSMDLAISRKL